MGKIRVNIQEAFDLYQKSVKKILKDKDIGSIECHLSVGYRIIPNNRYMPSKA